MLVSAFTSYHLKKTRLPSSSRRGWGWSEDGSEFTVLPPLAHPYLSVGRLCRRGTMLVSAFTSYHLKKARLPSLAGGEPFGSPPLPVITLRKLGSPPRQGGAGPACR